jgi:hypothetical protein
LGLELPLALIVLAPNWIEEAKAEKRNTNPLRKPSRATTTRKAHRSASVMCGRDLNMKISSVVVDSTYLAEARNGE